MPGCGAVWPILRFAFCWSYSFAYPSPEAPGYRRLTASSFTAASELRFGLNLLSLRYRRSSACIIDRRPDLQFGPEVFGLY